MLAPILEQMWYTNVYVKWGYTSARNRHRHIIWAESDNLEHFKKWVDYNDGTI